MIYLIIYGLIIHYVFLFSIFCLLLSVKLELLKLMIWKMDREREKDESRMKNE